MIGRNRLPHTYADSRTRMERSPVSAQVLYNERLDLAEICLSVPRRKGAEIDVACRSWLSVVVCDFHENISADLAADKFETSVPEMMKWERGYSA